MNVLVSACLMGFRCRYDGGAQRLECLDDLRERHVLIPVCPEVMGGLPTPRPPAERRGDRVVTEDGADLTAQYRKGAETALLLAEAAGCRAAILKANSPSCGCGQIYDGSFCHRKVPGDGVTAELLRAHGLAVYDETTGPAWLTSLADRQKEGHV